MVFSSGAICLTRALRRTHGLKTEIWDLNFSQLSDMAPEPPIQTPFS